jgi:hypothetical protein
LGDFGAWAVSEALAVLEALGVARARGAWAASLAQVAQEAEEAEEAREAWEVRLVTGEWRMRVARRGAPNSVTKASKRGVNEVWMMTLGITGLTRRWPGGRIEVVEAPSAPSVFHPILLDQATTPERG